MNKRMLWSRILNIVGLAVMAIGVLALFRLLPVRRGGLPFDGLWVFLLGSGLAALGAFFGKSRYRKFLYRASWLTVCGLALGILMTMMFFQAEDPPILVYVVLACPVCGGLMSLVGSVLVIFESFHRPSVPKDSVEAAQGR